MNNTLDWTSGPLAEGLHCYRTGQFFEAHEHWELVWLTLAQPEKSFLQALVQISAAFHHLGRGNRTGAISLLTRSLRRLDASPTIFGCIDVESLRKHVRNWIEALREGHELPGAVPDFRVISAS